MRRLYILRHAKSSWSDTSLSDFDRPLNERGQNTAPFMGELMAKRDLIPDVILSSPAVRAVQTARLVKDSAGIGSPLILDDRIYEASPQTLRQVVTGINNESPSAMLVGHNPGIEGFIRFLTGSLESMPTAALAVIDLNLENWDDANGNSGELVEIIRPKEAMRSANM